MITLPDELIRHIIGFARPTYGYMGQLEEIIDDFVQSRPADTVTPTDEWIWRPSFYKWLGFIGWLKGVDDEYYYKLWPPADEG